jgi:hypothetical protein
LWGFHGSAGYDNMGCTQSRPKSTGEPEMRFDRGTWRIIETIFGWEGCIASLQKELALISHRQPERVPANHQRFLLSSDAKDVSSSYWTAAMISRIKNQIDFSIRKRDQLGDLLIIKLKAINHPFAEVLCK